MVGHTQNSSGRTSFSGKSQIAFFIDPELTRLWPLKVDELTRPGMIARLVDTGSGYIKPEISWQ